MLNRTYFLWGIETMIQAWSMATGQNETEMALQLSNFTLQYTAQHAPMGMRAALQLQNPWENNRAHFDPFANPWPHKYASDIPEFVNSSCEQLPCECHACECHCPPTPMCDCDNSKALQIHVCPQVPPKVFIWNNKTLHDVPEWKYFKNDTHYEVFHSMECPNVNVTEIVTEIEFVPVQVEVTKYLFDTEYIPWPYPYEVNVTVERIVTEKVFVNISVPLCTWPTWKQARNWIRQQGSNVWRMVASIVASVFGFMVIVGQGLTNNAPANWHTLASQAIVSTFGFYFTGFCFTCALTPELMYKLLTVVVMVAFGILILNWRTTRKEKAIMCELDRIQAAFFPGMNFAEVVYREYNLIPKDPNEFPVFKAFKDFAHATQWTNDLDQSCSDTLAPFIANMTKMFQDGSDHFKIKVLVFFVVLKNYTNMFAPGKDFPNPANDVQTKGKLAMQTELSKLEDLHKPAKDNWFTTIIKEQNDREQAWTEAQASRTAPAQPVQGLANAGS